MELEQINKLLVNVNVLSMNKSFFFVTEDATLKNEDLVVVETTRGIELGSVVDNPIEKLVSIEEEYPHVIKRGVSEDLEAYNINKEKAKQDAKLIQDEANKLQLEMKIISTEYMLDASKIIIYYLADNRVDFRDLLKVLATLLKCRIEMRQVGTRDKAKMIGGIGICGLKLCCSTFLNEFDGISITMAKNQMLALNIPKLSGHCGKLICCLKYENDTYLELQKDLPRVGSKVHYNDQYYKITSMNVITKMIRIENKDNIQTVPFDDIKDHILPRDFVIPQNQPTPQPQQEKAVEQQEKVDNNPNNNQQNRNQNGRNFNHPNNNQHNRPQQNNQQGQSDNQGQNNNPNNNWKRNNNKRFHNNKNRYNGNNTNKEGSTPNGEKN